MAPRSSWPTTSADACRLKTRSIRSRHFEPKPLLFSHGFFRRLRRDFWHRVGTGFWGCLGAVGALTRVGVLDGACGGLGPRDSGAAAGQGCGGEGPPSGSDSGLVVVRRPSVSERGRVPSQSIWLKPSRQTRFIKREAGSARLGRQALPAQTGIRLPATWDGYGLWPRRLAARASGLPTSPCRSFGPNPPPKTHDHSL